MVPFVTLKRAALCAFSLADCALQAAESAFSASFGEYSPGEALGEKGARGGAWRVAEAATATNVVMAARAAMDYSGTVSFAASSACTGNVERVHFSLFVDALQKMDIAGSGGAAGLMPVLHDDGAAGYLVWGSGRWQRVVADGAAPEEGVWLEACVEFRIVNGARLVR